MNEVTAESCLKLMLEVAREGGRIALDLIEASGAALKADNSVITQADLTISALATGKLASLIKSGGHVLIDEEDPRRGEYLDDRFLDEHPYVWSLDPIDATRAYANRMPHYGISIGLLRNRRPWLGVVFFPSLGELFYCDGDAAYFVKKAFTAAEVRTRIVPVDEVITNRSLFIATDDILSRFAWKETDCRVLVMAAAVCEFCWPAIGRGCGSLARVHLWDLAGSWPIFQHAGLNLYALADGKILDRLEAGSFERGQTPWKFKDYYVLSSERNFPLLKDRIVSR